MARSDAELSILITDDDEIRSLNSAYRDLDRSTDVLSFSQLEGEVVPGGNELLGDIVISLDTAIRQAGELGHSVEEEMRRLFDVGFQEARSGIKWQKYPPGFRTPE